MCHAIYEFGVIFSKDLHGDDDLFIRAFFQMVAVQSCIQPPDLRWFCNLFFANIKWGHAIYAFGVILCKESNGEVVIVCCATYEIKVCSSKPGPCKSFVSNNSSFSASEIVVPSMISVLFHVFFESSSSSQLHHVVICVRLGSNFCCTYPCVNFTDTALLRNHRFTFLYLNSCML